MNADVQIKQTLWEEEELLFQVLQSIFKSDMFVVQVFALLVGQIFTLSLFPSFFLHTECVISREILW